jgi:4-hydroxy-tetrahydrodipicolinate reductase
VIEVVVSGGRGRLGARVVAAIEASADLSVAAVLGRADDAAAALTPGRLLFESAPDAQAAIAHVEQAAAAGCPAVLATTGLDAAGLARVEAAAARVPVVVAPNLSPGVTLLLDLVARAARALPDYDVELVELHHRHKRDAPSGTAWALAKAAAEARGGDAARDAIVARAGQTGARGDAEIGVMALRGGEVIGEHTVLLLGATERVELVHRAQSREVFAAGALSALRWLGAPGRGPGLASMRDVLGIGA